MTHMEILAKRLLCKLHVLVLPDTEVAQLPLVYNCFWFLVSGFAAGDAHAVRRGLPYGDTPAAIPQCLCCYLHWKC